LPTVAGPGEARYDTFTLVAAEAACIPAHTGTTAGSASPGAPVSKQASNATYSFALLGGKSRPAEDGHHNTTAKTTSATSPATNHHNRRNTTTRQTSPTHYTWNDKTLTGAKRNRKPAADDIAGFPNATATSALSHRATSVTDLDDGYRELALEPGWTGRWTATYRRSSTPCSSATTVLGDAAYRLRRQVQVNGVRERWRPGLI
jgi:hypothetical protein